MFAQFHHLKGSLKTLDHGHSLGMIKRIEEAFCFFLFLSNLCLVLSTLTNCFEVSAGASKQAMLFMDLRASMQVTRDDEDRLIYVAW